MPKSKSRIGRPTKEEESVLEEQILTAARQEFLARGYRATTIDQIAARARSSKRTIYAKFSTKAALFEKVVVELIETKFAAIERRVDPSKPMREQLVVLARAISRAALEPDSMAIDFVIMAEASEFPELVARLNETGFQRITSILGRVLTDAGVLSADIASEALYSLLVVNPMRYRFLRARPVSKNVERIVDFVLAGRRRP